VSRAHAVIVGGDPPRVEDMGSANGTRIGGVAVKPRATAVARPGVMIEVGSAMLVIQESGASREGRPPPGVDGAEPTPMGQIDKLVARLAPSNLSVLLLGETGVGKGVVAESIHRRSQRAAGPFLPLNCGALPESLLESELFGHEKGAFTGAVASTPG